MALNYSILRKPDNNQVVDPSTGKMREEWQLYFDGLTKRLNAAVGLGDVFGPASSTDGNLPSFDGTDGKTLQDSGIASSEVLVDGDIGTNVQAYDADLDTWAGLTPSANAQSLVTAANYAAMRALLDVEAGTDFYSVSTLNSTSNGNGASLIGVEDSAGNFSSTDVEGALAEANDSTQGRQTYWVEVGRMRPQTSGGAPAAGSTVSGDLQYDTLDFDPDITEDANFLIGMPKGWDPTANVSYKVHWTHAGSAGNDVAWDVYAKAFSDGDDISGTSGFTHLGSSTDTAQAASKEHLSPESAGAVISGAAKEDLVGFLVRRNGGAGADTFASDAKLIGVDIFYATDANTDD